MLPRAAPPLAHHLNLAVSVHLFLEDREAAVPEVPRSYVDTESAGEVCRPALSGASQELAQGASEQASSLEETASVLEEAPAWHGSAARDDRELSEF